MVFISGLFKDTNAINVHAQVFDGDTCMLKKVTNSKTVHGNM